MVFSSITFLYYFLPATLILYFASPARARNLVLLLLSLTFYTWGAGDFVLVLVATTLLDYMLGRMIGAARAAGAGRRVALLVTASVVHNVGLLAYFKYLGFFVDQASSLFGLFGHGPIAFADLVLPIGISFFVFERISYTADVARGKCRPQRNVIDFLLFVALFPRSIAGPIVRFSDIEHQLGHHPSTVDGVSEGLMRFSWGLAKKVIVADSCAQVADAAFAVEGGDLNAPTAWLGLAAYTLQIYFDFSGYSDMAIGLGQVFGFRLPENFRHPYSALSITDFWRRWHITLSSWFRDYVYIPLGGSRGATGRTLANLVGVFLITGLWHGASWTFVVWGAYHGTLLLVERVTGQRALTPEAGAVVARRAIVVLLVMVGWVFFRAESIGDAGSYLGALFGFEMGSVASSVQLALTSRNTLIMLLAATVVLLPADVPMARLASVGTGRVAVAARVALLGVALPYSALLVANGGFSPFLYFQF
jgi:alginate O-acetyltransferase complex protein AlgI